MSKEKERASLVLMTSAAGRSSVDAVSQQMASHPQYLESFLRAQHYILHMDGPLPLPCRHYIAIMVRERPVFPVLDHFPLRHNGVDFPANDGVFFLEQICGILGESSCM